MLAVIANPRSKTHLRDPRMVERLRHVLGDRGQVFAPASREALADTCVELRERGADLVAVHGGDGTLHVALGALEQAFGRGAALPRVAILPGGTLNTVAKGLGIASPPLDRLAAVADAHARGRVHTVRRPMMRIGEHAGFLFGHGLIANFMEAYYATGAPSPATGATLLARAAASATFNGPLARRLFTQPTVRVTVDGEHWPHDDHAAITCATVPEIGIGFRPFIHALDRDDAFEIVAFHCRPAQLVGLLPRIRMGAELPPDRVTTRLARRMVLESDAPFSYCVDGDLYSAEDGRLELSVGPIVDIVV